MELMSNRPEAPLWWFFPGKKYDGAFARETSPALYVHPGVPPMIVVHGAKDELVPPGQTITFAEALKKAGVDVTLRIDPDRGHDIMNAASVDEAIAFFKRTLKPSP
jgi:dipeptidyl aminopeptidase/acylaminoacyl peptidase